LAVYSKVIKKATHSRCKPTPSMLTTHWSQNCVVLGKGHQLQMLPSV